MSLLQDKKIIIGVCGSIAAYKIAILIRLLIKQGAEIKVIMTKSASDFITPLTLSTLSKNPVYTNFINGDTGQWHNHVELALWADAIVIAPASANTIAKFAQGICDNLLSAVYLSARCPIFIAPAMDLDMYIHPGISKNITLLREYGNHVIDAETGELASGLNGQGRMAEPENIISVLEKNFKSSAEFQGKHVMVTAGPTYEALDPVRYIGNHSTGKMGYAIAHQLAMRGANVILISGPTHLTVSQPNISLIKVTSASQMHGEALKYFAQSDIVILAAAVADYTPLTKAEHKIKKKDSVLNIELVKTTDIAQELGKLKSIHQFMVGFALETENELENATQKLKSKNLDLIVLNSLKDKGAGFINDTNKITLIDKNNKIEYFELKSKKEVAQDIVNAITNRIHA